MIFRHRSKFTIKFFFFFLFFLLSSGQVFAQAIMDIPHDPQGCLSCHDMSAFDQPCLIPNPSAPLPYDETTLDDTVYNQVCNVCHLSGPAKTALTHSSITTSNNHGDWSVGCSVCHNQHIQEQVGNKFIKNYVDRAKISGASKTDRKKVSFTGISTFANGDATYDGICEVCHESTGHWTETGLAPNEKHFASLNCIECHPHDQGMKAVPPDHASLIPVPSFCQSCHTNTIFGLHYSSENGWVNCDRCHDKADNYALTGSLPFYLDSKLTWNSDKTKGMLTSGQARCDECHQGQYHEHITDTGHGSLHDNIILGYDIDDNGTGDQIISCDACHYPDAVQEHVTRRGFSCSVCHGRTEIGLSDVVAISNTVTAGRAGTQVFCDDCHNDDHFLTDAGTSLVKEHHYSKYSIAGNCRKCHVVGPGIRGPSKTPCFVCHGAGKPADPQRAGVDKHDQGPAFTGDTVDDFRVCFSCHLDGGPGYVNGVTPAISGLLHAKPTGTVYWAYGYYKDGSNNWVAPPVLIPSNANPTIPANLESDPATWQGWPGFGTIRLLANDIRWFNRSGKLYDTTPYTDPPRSWAMQVPTDADGEDYWGIVNQTDTPEFLMRDYATLEITYNGDTQYVPSYDGTGGGGPPTGIGSLRVDISNAAAISAGARWRIDGGSWQMSSATVSGLTARENHLVEILHDLGLGHHR